MSNHHGVRHTNTFSAQGNLGTSGSGVGAHLVRVPVTAADLSYLCLKREISSGYLLPSLKVAVTLLHLNWQQGPNTGTYNYVSRSSYHVYGGIKVKVSVK